MSLYGDLPAPQKALDSIQIEDKALKVVSKADDKNETLTIKAIPLDFLPASLKRKAVNNDKKNLKKSFNYKVVEADVVDQKIEEENEEVEVNQVEKEEEVIDYEVYDPKVPNEYEKMCELREMIATKANNTNNEMEYDNYTMDYNGNFEEEEEEERETFNKVSINKADLAISGEEAYLKRLQLSKGK
ncbi:hypothetical protein K502DRAFT_344032 [Neoconidiobolus thromboides FSU 785]|nr:hypothetical protein K502DRAFT_344032 [Neoconidiobolus thromboides FSU 785]